MVVGAHIRTLRGGDGDRLYCKIGSSLLHGISLVLRYCYVECCIESRV